MWVANEFLVPLFLNHGNNMVPETIVTVKSLGLWKFFLKLPENKPTQQKLYSIFRQVLVDIWENSVVMFYKRISK